MYVRRCTLGLTSAEDNGGFAGNAEAAGTEAISIPNASLALLAPTSSSPAIHPARFEADIACQLHFDSFRSLVRIDCVPPLVRDHLVRC